MLGGSPHGTYCLIWGYPGLLLPEEECSAPRIHGFHPCLNPVHGTQCRSVAPEISSLTATPGELCPLQFTGSKDFRLHMHEALGSILGTLAGTQVLVWRYFGATKTGPWL